MTDEKDSENLVVDLVKVIERGTWRWLGQLVDGIPSTAIPISGISIRTILKTVGGTAYQIGRISPRNAFVVETPPFRLVYVRPAYTGYRRAALSVFPATPWSVDFDHAMGRKVASDLGFSYVLLLRIPPLVNQSHGPYEKAGPVQGLNLHKVGYADRRIVDKWIGRRPKHMRPNERPLPYQLENAVASGLTLKQKGRWAFAMGVEDDPIPLSALPALRPL